MKYFVVLLLVSGILSMESGMPLLLKEIRAIKSENNDFKNLLDLALSQGGKLDEVVTLIEELLDQMKQDQLSDDLEYAHRFTTIKLDIEQLQIILASLIRERSAKNAQLEEVINLINSLTNIKEAFQQQLNLINGQEEEVRNTRAQENASYIHRSETNARVLAALNEILPKLSAAVFKEGKAVLLEGEKAEMIEKLRRELGHNHPVAVLVAITAQFDVQTVTRIIEKLEYIRDAVIQGQQDEDQNELAAVSAFQTLIQQIVEIREKFTKELNVVVQVLQKKSNDKILLDKRITILSRDLTSTEKLLEQTKLYRDQYDASYQNRKSKRIAEIKTVQSAFDLVERYAKKSKS